MVILPVSFRLIVAWGRARLLTFPGHFSEKHFLEEIILGKEKEFNQLLSNDGKTFGELWIELRNATEEAIFNAEDIRNIDWSNLKPLFAQLLQTFGPILIQILLGALTKEEKPAT